MEMGKEEELREQYESQLVDNALKDISENNVLFYLATYGDAVQRRIDECRKNAQALRELNFFGPSLVCSVTAFELIIRFLLIRPLVQGAFLSDEWAEILSRKVTTGRTVKDQDLLPAVLRRWNVDITKSRISSGKPLWETVRNLWDRRHEFVHEASDIEEDECDNAIHCTAALMEIVKIFADKLGFLFSQSGTWAHSGSMYRETLTPKSPFIE